MNFFWVYDISNVYLFLIITGFFVLISVVGFLITEHYMERWLAVDSSSSNNDMVSGFISLIGVFYGITLGLIAVATWSNYTATDAVLSKEASYLGCMYKGTEGFPEPVRTELKKELKEITRYIIEEAWPIQQRGLVPMGGRTAKLEHILHNFNPQTEGNKIAVSKELDLLYSMLEIRRERKDSIGSGLPEELYVVLFVGAIINISMTWFIVGTKRSLHLVVTSLAAILIGSLIYLIIAMDYPYSGQFSVTPDAYQLIYNDVMRE
jgi:hypothetical protein